MKWRPVFHQDERVDREIDFHLEQLTESYIAKGVPAAEARRRARLDFGGQEQIKQQVREVHVSMMAEAFMRNLKAATRFIRRSPSFAVTVIVTLALGIGANSAVLSAMDAIVLRPLPFPHGDELVALSQHNKVVQSSGGFVAPPRLVDWDHLNSTFQAISGYYTEDVSLTSATLPEKLTLAYVAPRFLRVWGISPLYGRDFTADEEKFGGPSAVLVSYRFWLNHLQADSAAVGKPVQIGGAGYTVVGVLPKTFLFPDRDVDLWEPSPVDAPYAQNREATWFKAIGRMKPGVSLAQATADLDTVQHALGQQFPKTDLALSVEVQSLKSLVIGDAGASIRLLYGSVSLLLMIACTNIAALLMARTTDREHEIAIRFSMGASRAAIIIQLLTEVLVLALAGSVLGLALASAASHIFKLLSKDMPRLDEVTLNWHVVLYSLLCATICTLVCGLLPAIAGTKRNLSRAMSLNSRTQVAGRHSGQWILVGLQVSLMVTLLLASGLLLRSFRALSHVDPGFDATRVLTLRVSAGWGETVDRGKLTQRIQHVIATLAATPGVQNAATTATVPGNSSAQPAEFKFLESSEDKTSRIIADQKVVSPAYFAVVGIPLLQGESCSEGTTPTMMVNRSFVMRYSTASSLLGRHLRIAAAQSYMEPGRIVGIVGDAREQGLETLPTPTVYWCFSAPNPDPWYLVRTEEDPATMADTLRQRIHAIEPARSVFAVMPLGNLIDDRQADNRLRTLLLSSFAMTAVLLVSLGLYGTMSYLGRCKRREIGLRLALGALPRQIVKRFVLQGLRVTLLGSVAGLITGVAMTRLFAGMLYQVSPLDPLTYTGVFLITLLIAVAASLAPSVRAVKVDPSMMLRQE